MSCEYCGKGSTPILRVCDTKFNISLWIGRLSGKLHLQDKASGKTYHTDINFCPDCGKPLAEPEPLSFETLQDMNDSLVFVSVPQDFGGNLIVPSLAACNASNDDEPDEVYLTNNLGGRSTYDDVVGMGGTVYIHKPIQEP